MIMIIFLKNVLKKNSDLLITFINLSLLKGTCLWCRLKFTAQAFVSSGIFCPFKKPKSKIGPRKVNRRNKLTLGINKISKGQEHGQALAKVNLIMHNLHSTEFPLFWLHLYSRGESGTRNCSNWEKMFK